jgi:hypothetical protein
MKGAPGLILAIFLGLLGAVLNWVYLENKTKDVASISFLGIKDGVDIQIGTPLRSTHFVEVKIPERHAKNLRESVYLYEDRATLEASSATRTYQGGDLVFRTDYRTPPVELKLEQNEEMFWVPVDSRAFVPSLINPGDQIMFVVPVYGPTEARTASVLTPSNGSDDTTTTDSGPTEEIGPFEVRSLGDRLGTRDVMKAGRRAPVQERQVGIVVDTTKAEQVERAKRLRERLVRGDYRNISVILKARK